MARKSKFEEEIKTKPGRGRAATTAPPQVRGSTAIAKSKASEAPTEPPPPPEESIEVTLPKNPKVSGVRPKRSPPSAARDVLLRILLVVSLRELTRAEEILDAQVRDRQRDQRPDDRRARSPHAEHRERERNRVRDGERRQREDERSRLPAH